MHNNIYQEGLCMAKVCDGGLYIFFRVVAKKSRLFCLVFVLLLSLQRNYKVFIHS